MTVYRKSKHLFVLLAEQILLRFMCMNEDSVYVQQRKGQGATKLLWAHFMHLSPLILITGTSSCFQCSHGGPYSFTSYMPAPVLDHLLINCNRDLPSPEASSSPPTKKLHWIPILISNIFSNGTFHFAGAGGRSVSLGFSSPWRQLPQAAPAKCLSLR